MASFRFDEIERLVKHNDVVIVRSDEQEMKISPYRGKQQRDAILTFLRLSGAHSRAIVFSHHSPAGPIGVDVQSGESFTWQGL